MISESRLDRIITEEINKTDVESIVNRKISSSYDSREFKKMIRDIVADSIEDLYKTLFNKSSLWKGGVRK